MQCLASLLEGLIHFSIPSHAEFPRMGDLQIGSVDL
jgi:hypothetical protein